VGLGAGVHHQLFGAAALHRERTFDRPAVAVETEAHLGRHRHARRHGAPYRRHEREDQLGFVEQRGATAVAVHHLGRAAEIQVDAGRPEGRELGRVFSQTDRVGAHQLRPHRHASRGAAAVVQLGQHADEGPVGQQGARHADELRDAAIDAADPRQHVAQREVEKPLHRGQQNRHSLGARACSV
jgi:hypothetical protein